MPLLMGGLVFLDEILWFQTWIIKRTINIQPNIQ